MLSEDVAIWMLPLTMKSKSLLSPFLLLSATPSTKDPRTYSKEAKPEVHIPIAPPAGPEKCPHTKLRHSPLPDSTPSLGSLQSEELRQPFRLPHFSQEALIRGLIINPKISIHTAIFIKTKQNKPKVSSRRTWRVSSRTLDSQRLTTVQACTEVAESKYLWRFADDKTLRIALGHTTLEPQIGKKLFDAYKSDPFGNNPSL